MDDHGRSIRSRRIVEDQTGQTDHVIVGQSLGIDYQGTTSRARRAQEIEGGGVVSDRVYYDPDALTKHGSILEYLYSERIFDSTVTNKDGLFEIEEACDGYFRVHLDYWASRRK